MKDREHRDQKDGFNLVMQGYLYSLNDPADPTLKHQSPTKRLISMKNSTCDHQQLQKSKINRTQDYALTYHAAPGKSYVIEPHGGELKYELAKRNPEKFYQHVFNQDITKHTVVQPNVLTSDLGGDDGTLTAKARYKLKKDVQVTSKLTKRPLMKILEKINTKLHEKIQS